MELVKKIGTGFLTIIVIAIAIFWRVRENPWGLKGVLIGAGIALVITVIVMLISHFRDSN